MGALKPIKKIASMPTIISVLRQYLPNRRNMRRISPSQAVGDMLP
jgi:hypothetical protein